MIEDQQAERLVAEDERDVADRLDTDRAVDGSERWGRVAHRPVEDADATPAEGIHPGRRCIGRQRADGVDDLC